MSIRSLRGNREISPLTICQCRRWPAPGRRGVIAGDVRRGEVGLAHSSGEAGEQPERSGVSGAKERVQKTVERHGVTVEEAKNMMEKTDKSRAAYYNYYTNKTWGMASSYNFSIDVSVLGIDETVEFMKSFIERRLNKRPSHFG